jgi:hypothetical protein
MSLRLGALHDALLDPGNAEKAQRAAEEVAAYDNRLASIESRLLLLTWMTGATLAIVMGLLWLTLNLSAQIAGLAAKIP